MFCLANSPWAAPVLTLAGRTLARVAPAGRQGEMSDSTDRPAAAVTARGQRSLFRNGACVRLTSSLYDRQQLPTQLRHRLNPSLLRKAANLGSVRRSLKAGSGVQARLAANSGWRCSTARCSHWKAGSSSLRYA